MPRNANILPEALELAEVFFVGGDLPQERIREFVELFSQKKLVDSGHLCNTTPGAAQTQGDFGKAVAKLCSAGEEWAVPARKKRRVSPPLEATGFWQTEPVFIKARKEWPFGRGPAVPVGGGVG